MSIRDIELLGQAESNLLRAPNLRLGTTYSDGDNQLDIEAHLSPSTVTLTPGTAFFTLANLSDLIPPFSVSYGRRLFPDSQGVASISISTASPLPALSIAFSTDESAWDEDDDEHDFESGTENHPPSVYGFSSWRTHLPITLSRMKRLKTGPNRLVNSLSVLNCESYLAWAKKCHPMS